MTFESRLERLEQALAHKLTAAQEEFLPWVVVSENFRAVTAEEARRLTVWTTSSSV